MRLAVIPARGGSTRIPRKNIKLFCGKPIIAWSILSAIESGCFDQIIVSTDDEEVAETARQYGAVVPFLRPAILSDNFVGIAPVVSHAVQWYCEQKLFFNEICCIFATAPFVKANDIRLGLEKLRHTRSDYVFSVTKYPFPIQRALKLNENGRIEMFNANFLYSRSQDLEDSWHDAAQFYWGTSDAWLLERPIFSHQSTAIIIPRYRVQDIDTLEDWISAELAFQLLQHSPRP